MKLILTLSLVLSPLSLLAQAVFGSPSYIGSFTSVVPPVAQYTPPASTLTWHKTTAINATNTDEVLTGVCNKWVDSVSTNFLTARQAAPSYVTNYINGKPALRNTGASGYMDSTLPSDTKPFTLGIVFRPDDVTNDRILIGSSVQQSMYLDLYQGKARLVLPGVAVIGETTTSLTSSNWYVLLVTYSGAGAYNFYLNNAPAGNGTSDRSFSSGVTRFGVDNNAGGATRYAGYVAEIIKANAVWSQSDREAWFTQANAAYAIY